MELRGLIGAEFLERRSRFVCECLVDGKVSLCHLPNSGRLIEVLRKGTKVYLIERGGTKLKFRMVFAEKDGNKVLIDTGLTNKIAEELINSGSLGAFGDFKVEKREIAIGKRRFDLLLREGSETLLVEVKNSTLFRSSLSMFPDCETERGRSHVDELLKLESKGIKGGLLFLVSSKDVRYFMPDFHNDFAFFEKVLSAKDRLKIASYGFGINEDFSIGPVRELKIPWELLSQIRKDSGIYVILIHLPHKTELKVGSLGNINFAEGYYAYVGSARTNLTKRIERHLRRKRKIFWHIDFLTSKFKPFSVLPILGDSEWECEFAKKAFKICDFTIFGFGSSDCGCPSHLFGFKENPLRRPEFVDLIMDFRLGKFEEEIERTEKAQKEERDGSAQSHP